MDERFWRRVRVGEPDECWPFIGALANGYGQLSYNGKRWASHRLAYTLGVGPIPTGMHICHRCDTPTCVNPAHLFLGTAADNIHDAVRKGRNARGQRHGRRVLSEDNVRHIRVMLARGVPGVALATIFNVSEACISHIRTGKAWAEEHGR